MNNPGSELRVKVRAKSASIWLEDTIRVRVTVRVRLGL